MVFFRVVTCQGDSKHAVGKQNSCGHTSTCVLLCPCATPLDSNWSIQGLGQICCHELRVCGPQCQRAVASRSVGTEIRGPSGQDQSDFCGQAGFSVSSSSSSQSLLVRLEGTFSYGCERSTETYITCGNAMLERVLKSQPKESTIRSRITIYQRRMSPLAAHSQLKRAAVGNNTTLKTETSSAQRNSRITCKRKTC